MKKLLTILFVSCLFATASQAQHNNQNIQEELDLMMQQMEQLMKDLGEWMGDASMQFDTTVIQEFDFPSDELNSMFFHFSPDSLMNSDWLKQMEEQMQGWSNQDWSGFDDFFREFELQMPPSEEEFTDPDDPSKEKSPTQKRKKKKKVTTL